MDECLISILRAWYISSLERSAGNDGAAYYHKLAYEPAVPPPKSLVGRISAHPIWVALSADIFTGQIIASLIVLTFVAVFLLREWISQNARPGVFEDEEVFPDMPPAANDPPPQPAPNPPALAPPLALPDAADLEQRQQNAMRALELLRAEALRARDGNDTQRQRQADGNENGTREGGEAKVEPERKKKRVQKAGSETGGDSDEEGADHMKRKAHARSNSTKIQALRRRAVKSPPLDPSVDDFGAVDNSDSVYPFTFQASPLEPGVGAPAEVNGSLQPSADPLPSPPSFRRPRLPTAAPGPDSPFTFSPSRTPLGSPGLATYRAPEELSAAGSSDSCGFFGGPSQHLSVDGENADSGGNQSQSFDASQSFDSTIHESDFEDAFEAVPTPESSELNNILNGSEDQILPPRPASSQHPHGKDVPERYQTSDDVLAEPLDKDVESEIDPENEHRHYFRDADDGVPPSLPITPQPEHPELVDEVQEHEREPEPDLRRDEDDDDDEEPDEDADELLWNDAQWDGIEVEEVAEGQEQNVEGAVVVPDVNLGQGIRRGEVNAAADAEIPPDLADDLEGNVEDDMEGAMEGL